MLSFFAGVLLNNVVLDIVAIIKYKTSDPMTMMGTIYLIFKYNVNRFRYLFHNCHHFLTYNDTIIVAVITSLIAQSCQKWQIEWSIIFTIDLQTIECKLQQALEKFLSAK